MKHGMSCKQPATRWEDALPVGNGSIGAIVYGNICHETIIVNHEELWVYRDKPEPPDISGSVPELRELLARGEWSMLDRFLDMMLQEKGYDAEQKDNYHPALAIKLDVEPAAPFRDYTRELDFDTAEARVTWKESSNTHSRGCFVSRDTDVVCVTMENDANDVTYAVRLVQVDLVEENSHAKGKRIEWRDIPITFQSSLEPGWLAITGTYANGTQFGGVARVIAPGGKTSVKLGKMAIEGATRITLLMKVFVHESASDAVPRLKRELGTMTGTYDELLRASSKLHQALYNRVALDLGVEHDSRKKTNEALLLDAYDGDVPAALVERMFYYGRYLLACSSRPGGWPANLQGVWNGYYFPPWSSDYHNDENIQMNYWAALPGNFAETTLPYFDFYEACLEDCRRNARVVYGCRGILAPIAQTVKGKAPLYGGPWLNWVSGAGWLSQLFFDYWLFTRDDAFLRGRVVPYLKEIATFYEDFLIEDGNGMLVFSPSLSPENVPSIPDGSLATVNATMDVAVAKEVLSNLCKACERLGTEATGVGRWKSMLAKLPPYEVNADGAMREWLDPRLPDNYHHRHISHIYPLFPGFEITKETRPEIFDACRVAVDKRLVVGQESQSGWSLAHQASIWARLGQGDRALACIETVIRSCVGENLFTYHNDWRHMGLTLYWDFIDKLFQIDANFGIVAAVLEMLVFSSETMVKILPARPKSWQKGSISGLKCRCGIGIGFSWDTGSGLLDASIEPTIPAEITIKFPGKVKDIRITPATARVMESPLGSEYRAIITKPGEPVSFHVSIDFDKDG